MKKFEITYLLTNGQEIKNVVEKEGIKELKLTGRSEIFNIIHDDNILYTFRIESVVLRTVKEI